jgi:hypothetical protein
MECEGAQSLNISPPDHRQIEGPKSVKRLCYRTGLERLLRIRSPIPDSTVPWYDLDKDAEQEPRIKGGRLHFMEDRCCVRRRKCRYDLTSSTSIPS